MTYEELENNIGYTFNDISYLKRALMHTSYAAERYSTDSHLKSNERLEFVGDSVVGLIVAAYLYEKHPDWPEGEMTKIRASVVCEDSLAVLAKKLGVHNIVKLGVGEFKQNGRMKPSILSDAMESIVAAVFLDSDFNTARRVMLPFFVELIDKLSDNVVNRDFKSRLQVTLAQNGVKPKYVIVGETGPDHARIFTAEVTVAIDGKTYIEAGTGTTKRNAEQAAAGKLLSLLEGKI